MFDTMLMGFILRIVPILLTLFSVTKSFQITGEPIFHFSGQINGANPESSLTEVNNSGILYGVTGHGGISSVDYGVIYRIDTNLNNNFTVVYLFTNATGCQPTSPLIYDGGIFLYGSTIRCSQFGYGNLFRFNLLNNIFDIIYEFSDVTNPSKLLLDKKSGLLYGVASVGSSSYYGSLFTLDIRDKTPSTTFKQLFSFNYVTGAFPSDLVLVNDSLYINTQLFGEHGGGTLVVMDRDGGNARLIYAFGSHDILGCCPWGQLVLVTDEHQQQYLYGTTMGAADCSSTIYRVGLTMITNQIEFVATLNETTVGSEPFDGLIESINPFILYGVTSRGGVNNRGTVFRINVKNGGSLEKLFDFPSDDTFGYQTLGGLVEVGNNTLYGAADLGGKYGFGTIYKITIQ